MKLIRLGLNRLIVKSKISTYSSMYVLNCVLYSSFCVKQVLVYAIALCNTFSKDKYLQIIEFKCPQVRSSDAYGVQGSNVS